MKQNIEPTFYFHDYETFGINPALDRPSQFAGIRTDSNLNIIDEPLVLYCKQSDDYLPNPEAVLLTGITPQITQQKGLCEAKFSEKIHREFSQSNTCILGYNNIRFDDEVTRNIFYRNFIDPYAYSWRNGNSRWDLLDVVRACYALRPEGIEWPTNKMDLPSFRLEDLTRANRISHENAHDAMSDVYATIEIAKLIKQKQPKLFDYFFKLRNKKNVADLLDVINIMPLVHVSGMLGAYRGNTTLIAPIAWHPCNPNAIVVCDLAGDVDLLLSLDAAKIKELLYTKTEDLGIGQSRIPLKLVHINKAPIIAPVGTLSVENAKRLSINLDICSQNLNKVRSSHILIQQKIELIFRESTFADDSNKTVEQDVDAMIYQGFFDSHDKQLCDMIRQTDLSHLDSLKISPNDARLNVLFFRYKARNYPSILNEQEQLRWKDHCQTRLNHETLQNYFTQLESLVEIHKNDTKKISLLKNLYLYAQQLVS